jgi:hypothetical protein
MMKIKLRFTAKTIPFFLLALCLLSYGLIAHRLGFYWDDWPSIWFLHISGPTSYIKGFEIDRPLLAWVFMLTTSLLGESILAWQLFGIFTRWLASLALFWGLYGLWPGRARQAAAVALLFALYPGFTQQYIAVTYSNAFLVFTIFLLSFGCMIWAFRLRHRFWLLLILSYLSLSFSLFVSEYFYGLELLRPFILWLLLEEQSPALIQRARRVLLYWLPYAVIVALYTFWRLFLHESPRAVILIFDRLQENPVQAILSLGLTVLKDLFEVTALAWANFFFNLRQLFSFDPVVIAVDLLALVVAAGLTFIFLNQVVNGRSQSGSLAARLWARQAVALGILALLLGGLPIWVTNLHIELKFPWDRFTLTMMLGASLLLAGLVEWIARRGWQSSLLLGILAGLAVGINFYSALTFRQDWLAQKAFFWQLTWRAPGIEPGTIILTAEMPFSYYSDNSLTAPLNWIYAPQYQSGPMPYMLYNIESRLGNGLSSLEAGVPIHQEYRITSFNGSTDQAIVLFYAPPRCLKVVDPQADRNLPYKPVYIPDVLPLSKPDLIQEDANPPAVPPVSIFGPQPEHDWCYYFERAELARQQGDWAGVVELGDQAQVLDRKVARETASELVPFVVGYAHMRQWQEAVQLTLNAYRAADKTQNMLCQAWYEVWESELSETGLQDAMLQIEDAIQCNFP